MGNLLSDAQRLEIILLDLKINKNELSRQLGYKNNAIFSNIANGRNGISDKIARKISDNFPQFNYEWILRGTGEKTRVAGKNNATLIGSEARNVNVGDRIMSDVQSQKINEMAMKIKELEAKIETKDAEIKELNAELSITKDKLAEAKDKLIMYLEINMKKN